MRLIHTSIRDFLVDEHRCGQQPYYIDAVLHLREFSSLCLNIMLENIYNSMPSFTQYKLNSIEPLPSVWKMIHVVLNDSSEGCLTTREVEEAIRLRYRREIKVFRALSATI